jgi:predicted MFS family arabinose efflux permease
MRPSPLRLMLAGTAATFLGVGMQRFAYALLLPAMIAAGSIAPGMGGVIGAANLGGYLLGALFGPRLEKSLRFKPALFFQMALVALSFAAAAVPWPWPWLAFWRVVAGFAGGTLMVMAGPAVQALIAPEWRGLAAGFTFFGVGSGVVASALALPPLLAWGGIAASWNGLALAGAATLGLSVWLWRGASPPPRPLPSLFAGLGQAANLRLVAAYAAAALAAVPHMLWWPDFIARGLNAGRGEAAAMWLIYGLGAAFGPLVLGRMADLAGLGRTLVFALALQAIADLLPLFSVRLFSLVASSVSAGATATGLSGLFLLLCRREGMSPALWSLATAAYGAMQTAGGFLLAWLYAMSGKHTPLFAVGLGGAILTFLLTEYPRGERASPGPVRRPAQGPECAGDE